MTADDGRTHDRPWWASQPDGGTTTEDPLGAHRRARHAAGADEPDASWGEAAEQAVRWASEIAEAVHAQAVANAGSAAGETPPTSEAGTSEAPENGGPETEATANGTSERHQHAPGDHDQACRICPICTGLRALSEHRPELVGHLAEAARHVQLAARTLLDPPDAPGRERAADAGAPFERIDLDDADLDDADLDDAEPDDAEPDDADLGT